MAEKNNNKETEEMKDRDEMLETEHVRQIEKYMSLKEKYLDMMDNNERLVVENLELSRENKGLTEKRGNLENRNKKLTDKNKNLEYENKKLLNKCIVLNKNITRLEKEHANQAEKYECLRMENKKLQDEYDLLAEWYQNMEAENSKLKELDDLKRNNVYAALHQELKDLVETAHEVHNECYKVIKKLYKNEETFTLPIDIQKVAEKLEINIEFDNLNFAEHKRRIDQNIAQLYYEESNGSVKKKIIVDNSKSGKKSGPLSNLEKYAVAYELGKVIVGNEQKMDRNNVRKLNLESRPYSLPRLSAHLENFEYEMCAIFLLLPMELFFKEFQNFINEIKDHPVLMEKWIEHLSEKADIPSYQLINGYQYIKFSAYRYYEEYLSNKEADGPDYRGLYNV